MKFVATSFLFAALTVILATPSVEAKTLSGGIRVDLLPAGEFISGGNIKVDLDQKEITLTVIGKGDQPSVMKLPIIRTDVTNPCVQVYLANEGTIASPGITRTIRVEDHTNVLGTCTSALPQPAVIHVNTVNHDKDTHKLDISSAIYISTKLN